MNQIITINTDCIKHHNVDLSIWERDNRPYLVSSLEDASHSHGKLFLDLVEFYTKGGPEDWTKKNGKFICFEGSRLAIEDVHTIDLKDNIEEEIEEKFRLGTNKKTLTVADLIKKGCKFDQETYDEYMIFELVNGNLDVTFGNYDPQKFCFSYPFFKSILVNNHETKQDKCVFNFVEIEVESRPVLTFFVEFSRNSKKYYDYSQNPPAAYLGKITGLPKDIKRNATLDRTEELWFNEIEAFDKFKKQF